MDEANGEPLTEQQKTVFEFIKSYIENNGYAPLFREIQDGADLSNVGLVHKNIEALQKKGYVNKKENKKRGIELTKVGKNVEIGHLPGQLNLFNDWNESPSS